MQHGGECNMGVRKGGRRPGIELEGCRLPFRPAAHPTQFRYGDASTPNQCRLVYLDADMLVVRNIDCLFGLPPGFYAGDCANVCCAVFAMNTRYQAGMTSLSLPRLPSAQPPEVASAAAQGCCSGLLLCGAAAAPDCAAGRETQQERDACSLFCPQQPAYFNAGGWA